MKVARFNKRSSMEQRRLTKKDINMVDYSGVPRGKTFSMMPDASINKNTRRYSKEDLPH